MAGYDPEDPASADRPVADFSADLHLGARGLRIGVVRHFFESDCRASDATLAGIDSALDVFRAEGAEVRDITLSPLADYHAPGYVIMLSEALAVHAPWFRTRFGDYSEIVQGSGRRGGRRQRRGPRAGAAMASPALSGAGPGDGRAGHHRVSDRRRRGTAHR